MSQILGKWIADETIGNRHLITNDNYVLGSLEVIRDATIGGAFYIGGDSTVGGDFFINGDTTVNGSLVVNGPVTDYDATFAGIVTVRGDMRIDGDTTIGRDLYVNGDTTINGSLVVNGPVTDYDATFTGILTVQQDIRVIRDSTIGQNLLVSGRLNTTGDTTVGQNLSVLGNSFLGNSVSDLVTISGDTTIGQSLSVLGRLNTTGDTSVGQNLSVLGNSSLGNAITDVVLISGDITTNQNLSVSNNIYATRVFATDFTSNGDMHINAGGFSYLYLGTENIDRWWISPTGHILPGVNNTYDLGGSSYQINNLYSQSIHIEDMTANRIYSQSIYTGDLGLGGIIPSNLLDIKSRGLNTDIIRLENYNTTATLAILGQQATYGNGYLYLDSSTGLGRVALGGVNGDYGQLQLANKAGQVTADIKGDSGAAMFGGTEYLKTYTYTHEITAQDMTNFSKFDIAAAVDVSKIRSIVGTGVHAGVAASTTEEEGRSNWTYIEATSTTITGRYGTLYTVGDQISITVVVAV
jgi:ubiquinone biosynthesis protein UbiJ